MDDLVSKIKEYVVLHDLFDMCTPPIVYDTRAKECQINCPFHGADLGPSARVYPKTNSMHCFACDQSWDVIDFWAEINGWYKEDGKLDVGKSIKDLADRYSLRTKRADWKKSLFKSLNSIAQRNEGYSGTNFEEKQKVMDTYSWMISKNVDKIPPEDRETQWQAVKKAWDELDSVDLHSNSWKKDLHGWMREHRTINADCT